MLTTKRKRKNVNEDDVWYESGDDDGLYAYAVVVGDDWMLEWYGRLGMLALLIQVYLRLCCC